MPVNVRFRRLFYIKYPYIDTAQIPALRKKPAAPNPQEYVANGGKEVLRVLQLAAELIPVPLLRNVLGAAIKVVEVCEVSISAVRKVSSKLTLLRRYFRRPQPLKRKFGNCKNVSKLSCL